MINRKDYYGRNCNPHFWFRRGYFVEVRACANGFLQVFSPPGALPAPKREWCFPAGRYVRRRGSGGSPPGALSAPKGEWPYTEATPSGAAPTSPPEGVFRHKRRMELVELSGRTTGRLGYTRRPEPTPSEGRQRWHNDALSSPQPPPPALFLRDDCGPARAVGDGHRRRFRRGRRTFPGTTGRMEQRAD